MLGKELNHFNSASVLASAINRFSRFSSLTGEGRLSAKITSLFFRLFD